MNKIKNFLYDTNDILVAIVIICCAALVITTRVDAIMTYPEKMLSEQSSTGGYIRSDPYDPYETYDPYDPYDPPRPNEPAEPDDPDEPTEPGEDEPPEDAPPEELVNYSLYIAFGQSMNTIADNLIQLGFFENRQDFHEHITRHNADQRVQAGTFIIPSDSTKDKVIEIITGN